MARVKPLPPLPAWVYAQVGYGAGVSLVHPHWHLIAPPGRPNHMETRDWQPLFTSDLFESGVTGVLPGQTVIRPKDRWCDIESLANPDYLSEFVRETYRVVEIFNLKFNYPDYCLTFALNSSVEWHARYTPILAMQGAMHFGALDHGTAFPLPWPHQATVKHLLHT
ncbi:MAG: hypothetical protein V1489_03025 [Candidatus Liptonbacteria bacterium]